MRAPLFNGPKDVGVGDRPDPVIENLEGRINPGLVLDYETDLGAVADAYAAMDERRAIKSLVTLESR